MVWVKSFLFWVFIYLFICFFSLAVEIYLCETVAAAEVKCWYSKKNKYVYIQHITKNPFVLFSGLSPPYGRIKLQPFVVYKINTWVCALIIILSQYYVLLYIEWLGDSRYRVGGFWDEMSIIHIYYTGYSKNIQS